jgi:3-methyl-2-oxobutanoate hydroxymethyltransferase
MKDFREMKRRGERITALTAYDYPTARLLDESGIDIILVGDSLGMVVLGYQDTTRVTFDEMLHHTRAAARGVKQALLVADMPIHTYDTPRQAVDTAKQFVAAGAQAVKLEGGTTHVAQIEAITQAGIPFMAHIGMLPQNRGCAGGGKSRRLFCRIGDRGRRYCEANHECDWHTNHRHWIRRPVRRANFGDARFNRFVSVVHTKVCLA